MKVLTKGGLLLVLAVSIAACTSTYDRTAYQIDENGNKRVETAYNCPDTKHHSETGVITPPNIRMQRSKIIGPARSAQEEVNIAGCNQDDTIFANSHDPMLKLGVGYTKVDGGSGDTYYAPSASAGASAGAGADASAGASAGADASVQTGGSKHY